MYGWWSTEASTSDDGEHAWFEPYIWHAAFYSARYCDSVEVLLGSAVMPYCQRVLVGEFISRFIYNQCDGVRGHTWQAEPLRPSGPVSVTQACLMIMF